MGIMDFKQASEMRYNIQPATEFMKPVVYADDHYEKCEVIASGHYNGLNYYVKNIGHMHPTAYVEIPQGHKAFCQKKLYDLECHYGVTFNEMYLGGVDDKGAREHQFVGWDYAHYGDYISYYKEKEELARHSHRWTTEEIVKECKEAIDWINENI
jgi:hypothetical protein